jgi:hypothetical protein
VWRPHTAWQPSRRCGWCSVRSKTYGALDPWRLSHSQDFGAGFRCLHPSRTFRAERVGSRVTLKEETRSVPRMPSCPRLKDGVLLHADIRYLDPSFPGVYARRYIISALPAHWMTFLLCREMPPEYVRNKGVLLRFLTSPEPFVMDGCLDVGRQARVFSRSVDPS